MPVKLPEQINAATTPLFEHLPIALAMSQLVVAESGSAASVKLVEHVTRIPSLHDPLAAGLWLYVDELDRSHRISQGIDDATGAFWHGIMHRREGDFSNSHYWFNRVGAHPAMSAIDGYDAHAFIDDVEAATSRKANADELIDLQQREWTALFQWCAHHP